MDSKYSNDVGTKDLKDILSNVDFDYPKPVSLIKKLCVWLTEPEDLVVDLFAGSGTTAQAVLELNQELGHNRKFILVNLPEELDESQTAYQAGYRTVSELSLARINAAMVKTLQVDERALRVYKLAPSAFDVRRDDVEAGLFQLVSTTLAQGASMDVAASSILLKSGQVLSERLRKDAVTGGWLYVSGTAIICATLEITEEIIDQCLAGPFTFIAFLEDSFAGKDDLKSRAFFGARNRNQIVKFY
jgi:adenine-specific DNA-methyltransferase